MKLHELVNETTFLQVARHLPYDNKMHLAKYAKTYCAIAEMEPREVDESWRLAVEVVTEDGEEYIEVCGKNGMVYKDFGEEYKDRDYADDEMLWALEYTHWGEWLSMELKIPDGMSNGEAMAHILREMTYIGWTLEDVRASMDRLDRVYNKSGREPTDEG